MGGAGPAQESLCHCSFQDRGEDVLLFKRGYRAWLPRSCSCHPGLYSMWTTTACADLRYLVMRQCKEVKRVLKHFFSEDNNEKFITDARSIPATAHSKDCSPLWSFSSPPTCRVRGSDGPGLFSALAYLACKKMVHHNVKLESIFIRGTDVLLGDFGLCGST